MCKNDIVEAIILIIISIINISIACLITFSLGIQNVVLHRSLTTSIGDITYEVIIFMILSLLEATFYHYKFEKYYCIE